MSQPWPTARNFQLSPRRYSSPRTLKKDAVIEFPDPIGCVASAYALVLDEPDAAAVEEILTPVNRPP
jgi:hypothetical protein